MPKRKRLAERQCLHCEKMFMAYANGKSTAKYCSKSCASLDRDPEIDKRAGDKRRKPLVEKTCLQCGKQFFLKPMGQSSVNQKFCSKKCAAVNRFCGTEIGRTYAARMRAGGCAWKGTKRPDVAERMRNHNPTSDPEVMEKIRLSLKGKTFLSRGGNGKLTRQQEALCLALGLPEFAMEHVIPTANAGNHFQSLPTSYKVDLGIPEVKLAIEVDGHTHTLKKWKFLDRRKTAVLNFLGWMVLRFWNEEVDRDLERCVQTVMSTISRLREIITTSQTESWFTTATSSNPSHPTEE